MAKKMAENSVMFVCFGNIVRSPMAEAVFKKILQERFLSSKWTVDSAGVGSWYIGSDPDPRTIHVLKSRGYEISRKVKQVEEQDFLLFNYILAMDDECLFDLKRMAPPGTKTDMQLLGSYDPSGELYIDDPYYTKGDKMFYKVLEHCKRSCEGFFRKITSASD